MVVQRIQKIISASGFCSRRKAEHLIKQGRVLVNGKKASIGESADPENDVIMIGRKRIIIEPHLTIMLNKPVNYLTTKSDLWNRRSVMDLVPGLNRSVYPVGRLDRNARGLLIMTSDGDLAQKILHPSNGVSKTYQVIIDKTFSKESREMICKKGIIIDGRRVFAKIRLIKPKLLTITVHEGRNKIVKRIFKKLGYHVNDLKRIKIGGLKLDVPEGDWRVLSDNDIKRIFS